MLSFNLIRTLRGKIKNLKADIKEYDILSVKLLRYFNNKIDKSGRPIICLSFHTIKQKLNIDFPDPKLKKLISIVCENNRHIALVGRYVIILKH